MKKEVVFISVRVNGEGLNRIKQNGEVSELRKVGEFGLIHRLHQVLINFGGVEAQGAGVECGIGDDAAVLNIPVGEQVLVTTDLMVEGSHFIWEKITPAALGHKLMASNLSDIAAMGGTPRFAVVTIGINSRVAVEAVEAIYQGMQNLANRFCTVIVGGDTVASTQITLGLTLLGTVPTGKALLRSGAQPGDFLLVTGYLGRSAAGLELVLGEGAVSVSDSARNQVLEAHYRPWPRVDEGKILAILGIHALIDISDGLASEVGHICRQSRVGAEIWWNQLPIDDFTQEVAVATGHEPREWALYGGEDYELLMAVPFSRVDEVKAALEKVGCISTSVGRILPSSAGVLLDKPEGLVSLEAKGFDHFSD